MARWPLPTIAPGNLGKEHSPGAGRQLRNSPSTQSQAPHTGCHTPCNRKLLRARRHSRARRRDGGKIPLLQRGEGRLGVRPRTSSLATRFPENIRCFRPEQIGHNKTNLSVHISFQQFAGFLNQGFAFGGKNPLGSNAGIEHEDTHRFRSCRCRSSVGNTGPFTAFLARIRCAVRKNSLRAFSSFAVGIFSSSMAKSSAAMERWRSRARLRKAS